MNEKLKGDPLEDKKLSGIMDSLTSLQSKVEKMESNTLGNPTTSRNDSFSQGQLRIIEGIIEKKMRSNGTAEQNFVINTMSASSISDQNH